MGKRSRAASNAAVLREAMARRLHGKSVVSGSVTLPAVPAMIDEYVAMCDTIFAAVGRRFTPEQLGEVKAALESQLAEAYQASQRSQIVITYDAPVGTVLSYHVRPEWLTIESSYENWIATREPPLFGTEPDARVWAAAHESPDPSAAPVLDIGAGTGRNSLALARRGHPVDAVEVTPKFADRIRNDAAREFLVVRVIERDIFTTLDDLRQDYQLIVLSEVVSDFRTTDHLRSVFELAAHCLAPGGRLVFNTFVGRDAYTIDDATRQLGQQLYTSTFTRDEIASAAAGLPLALIADDSVYEYEQAHLPDGAWPPTSWYAGWVSGTDVFDAEREKSPIEMRWLVYQKPDQPAVPQPLPVPRPTICLNMIVRNEAHIVHEVLDAVAPYISSWVIVDTGSNDGTQDIIRRHMAALGIPGELHERPWRNFGANRSEALELAQGHADYIWVIDADDAIDGVPDFSSLSADVHYLRYLDATTVTYWRPQLFRNGLRWRYEGVVHEFATCDDPAVAERCEGDYHIESRRLGARNQDPQKYARDRDLLLAEVERNPDDSRSVFYLAQSYFDLGDFTNAKRWYARRAEMGGWNEEVHRSLIRVAESMATLDEPWPDVQDAFLRAWESRPVRAEPLHAIASRYRTEERYQLGYQFAQRAAEIPFPETDSLFVFSDIYAWRALDELAVCASRLGKHPEAFEACRRLLAGSAISDNDRKRIAGNRDWSVPAMLEAASAYPEATAQSLVPGSRDSDITVTLVAGPERESTELALNSFLNSCADVSRVGRFLVVSAGLSAADRAILLERYQFLEFSHSQASEDPDARLAQIRGEVGSRFWLHLGQNWRFFAPEPLLTRLTAVLDAESEVYQVAINYGDATALTGLCAPEDAVRRAPGTGRYCLTDTVANGPAMFDTARLARAADGALTASLDEVLCISGD